jgi:hypothetical protein
VAMDTATRRSKSKEWEDFVSFGVSEWGQRLYKYD